MKNLTFRQCEQALTEQDITDFEERIGARLPGDFIQHYKEFNGGYPNANWSEGEEINYPFKSFLSIKYGEDTIEKMLSGFRDSGFDYGSKIVFAVVDSRFFFCIDLSDEFYGQVFVRKPKYMKDTRSYSLPKGEWQYHCACFSGFLDGLNQINYYIFRYRNGYQQEVWHDFMDANDISGELIPFRDIDFVLKETMNNVRLNISTIFQRLQSGGYRFNSDHPVGVPDEETECRIEELKNIVKPFGYIPLSLEYFYRIVGSVNFIPLWNSRFPYRYSDPLYIGSIDETISLAEDRDWEDPFCMDISPDYFHKDDISGGPAYGIEITREQQIDSRILNTPYGDLFFIDYLRLCFDWGGFPGIKNENDDYSGFINDLKNGLKTF